MQVTLVSLRHQKTKQTIKHNKHIEHVGALQIDLEFLPRSGLQIRQIANLEGGTFPLHSLGLTPPLLSQPALSAAQQKWPLQELSAHLREAGPCCLWLNMLNAFSVPIL